MKLTAEQIRAVTTGAVRICEEGELVRLFRFTPEQEQLYRDRGADFHAKALSSAGMRLCFRTDSRSLLLSVETARGSSRRFFSFDVFVDGEPAGYLDNWSSRPFPGNYIAEPYPLGAFTGRFALGGGVKTVTVYLPWSVTTAIREVTLDDGAFLEPVRRKKTLLVYGDSITQGYDALRPSLRYPAALADLLGAEEINRAIGGEVFCPALAELAEPLNPDYVLVSYGSNDWSRTEAPVCAERCRDFYQTLSARYPGARIFALTPVWRADWLQPRLFGPFESVESIISDCVKDLPRVTLICGAQMIPRDTDFYSDRSLHPNDTGFSHYCKNLCAAVVAALAE